MSNTMETLIKDNGISMKKIFRGMVLLLCCAAMVFTAGCSRKKGGSTAEKNTSDSVAMPGFFAGEEGEPLGLVHIPDMQGDSLQVEFAWSAEDHWVTPDRTKAVYIVVDELVVYDFTRDLKDYDFINAVEEELEDVEKILHVTDNGVLVVNDDEVFRVTFRKGEITYLGTEGNLFCAPGSLSCVYEEAGMLYVLPEGQKEPETLARLTEGLVNACVTNDGRWIVWQDGESIHFFDGERITTLSTYCDDLRVQFSKDQKLAIVTTGANGGVFVIRQGKDLFSVHLPNAREFIADSGYLFQVKGSEIRSLYCLCEDDSLVHIRMDGETEEVYGSVEQVCIRDGNIVMLTSYNELWCGEIEDAQIRNPYLIDSGVWRFYSTDAQHIFYKMETHELYAFRMQDRVPTMLDSFSWTIQPTIEADRILYTDFLGKLYDWSFGDDVPVKVHNGDAEFVVNPSGRMDYLADPDGYLYLVEAGETEDGQQLYDLYFCSGNKSTLLAEDVFY